jgi:MEMO1 family protein
MDVSVRKPAVAGRFYPGNSSSLTSLIDQLLEAEKDKIDYQRTSLPIIGGVVPHAGMVYSGYQAVHFFEIVRKSDQKFDTIVIINPNHSGRGSGWFNTSSYHYWETPLGKVAVDVDFTEAMDIEIDNQAHDYEHSGEVQLPFVQHFLRFPIQLVMITMNVQNVDSAILLASKINDAAKQTGRKILLVASSDFNHYESPEKGYQKDQYVVDKILDFDSQGVYDEVRKHHVTACGYGTIMTLLNYSKMITNRPSIAILKRGHSGEVYPSEEVVDYVSFLISGTNIG